MVAVGIGLAWGRGGLLTLGQGLFFGLGGYIMAMHLKLTDAGPGGVPDFMVYTTGEVPPWWEPFRSPVFTLIAIPVIPALVAALIGWVIFSRGVRGAYFAILSQALVAAFAIWLIGNQDSTGGTNGLNGFRGFFGYDLADPINQRMLYFICGFILIAMVVISSVIRRSRYGELLVAVRDQENRVRFLGYNPGLIKLVAYVMASVFAAIGGALFVPVVGMISPTDVGVTPSIMFLAGVVLGGRTTLLGPVLATIAVRVAETQISEALPSFWTYLLGALFVVVIVFLPRGIAGLFDRSARSGRTPA
jgi:urea transport system permease protein